eukprot:1157280-Pelagomonas_calceolata.AAC.5
MGGKEEDEDKVTEAVAAVDTGCFLSLDRGESLGQHVIRNPGSILSMVCPSPGSQSTRCYLFDSELHPLGAHQEALHMLHPDHGWAEYDPLQIWKAVQTCMIMASKVSRQPESGMPSNQPP